MVVVPHLIIKRGNDLLLLKRASDNKLWPSHWHCVTGKVEVGESPYEAIVREAQEEVGIVVSNLEFITVVSVDEPSILSKGERFYGLELVFLYNVREYDMPFNREPSKHSDIRWFNIDKLPDKIIPGVKVGIDNYRLGIKYSDYRN
jgi:8-oxo-dGTP diphosphatase